jgi:hypothetical protein
VKTHNYEVSKVLQSAGYVHTRYAPAALPKVPHLVPVATEVTKKIKIYEHKQSVTGMNLNENTSIFAEIQPKRYIIPLVKYS